MDRLQLPRTDWYDEEGRIYKDALIENFNAIETKLNEINALNAFSNPLPDIGNISLEDVTLEDDNNKVINLKSFLTITGLMNYPIELSFSGTKIKRFAYWNSEYHYIVKQNVTTSLTSTNKYLFYNYSTETFTVTSDASTIPENSVLLGVYIEGRVINLTTPYISKLNLMYLLGSMQTSTMQKTIGPGQSSGKFGSGQGAYICRVESKGGSQSNQFREEGV